MIGETGLLISNYTCVNFLIEELENTGRLQLTVYGDSMLPTLKNGEIVTVAKSSKYRVGDIIAYYLVTENGIKIIVHRVMLVRKNYVLAKGDNNTFIDPIKILVENIIGVVK